MNVVALPAFAFGCITLYVGLYHLYLFFRRGHTPLDLYFFLMCIGVAVYDACCVGLYNSNTVAEGEPWMWGQMLSVAVVIPLMLLFSQAYTQVGLPRLIAVVTGIVALLLALIPVVPPGWGLMVNEASIKTVELWAGASVTYYEAVPGPLFNALTAVGIMVLVYVVWQFVEQYRRGDRARALAPLVAFSAFALTGLNDALVVNDVLHSIYLLEYGYFMVVLFMAYSLGNDLVEASAAKEALYEGQRLESIGRLAGGIAHDFNNLLTPILGYTDLALEAAEVATARPSMEKVRLAAQGAASLTRQLLTFSRREVLDVRLLDVNEAVRGVQALLSSVIIEGVDLQLHLPEKSAVVRADISQVQQIVINLVVNARDALPRGGTIVLEVGEVELDQAAAAVFPDGAAGSFVTLSVQDDGDGMNAETRRRLFEPFYTTKEFGKGTGLGLATVQDIVQQQGGFVEVVSEQGEGSTLRVFLPRIEGALPPRVVAVVRDKPSKPVTVLIVEDDEMIRDLTRRILERDGYRVLLAKDGPAALEIASRSSEPPDLLLSDVLMPGMNGPQLSLQLRELLPELAVVYMSGWSDEVLADDGLAGGSPDFLQKPFAAEDLLAKLSEVLSAGLNSR